MLNSLNKDEALVYAAIGNKLEKVKQLIETGVNINATLKGDTALGWAVHNGHLELVDYLLQNGALVNVKDLSGNMPLHWALFHGHEAVVKRLILAGADKQAINNNSLSPSEFAFADSKKQIKTLETIVQDMASEIKLLKQQMAAMQSQSSVPSNNEENMETATTTFFRKTL